MAKQLDTWLRSIWGAHALYFVVGSIWALVGRRSFEAVTGPKVDYWLVRTVASLLGVVGIAIGFAGRRQRITPEIAGTAIGSSAALTAIDVVYVSRKRISPVYLLDGLGNLVLIGGWFAAIRRGAVLGEGGDHT